MTRDFALALAKELAHAVTRIGEELAAEGIALHLQDARSGALEEAAKLCRKVCDECAEGWHDESAAGWRGHVRAAGQCVESRILTLKERDAPDTWRPAPRGPSDKRELGAAFRAVTRGGKSDAPA